MEQLRATPILGHADNKSLPISGNKMSPPQPCCAYVPANSNTSPPKIESAKRERTHDHADLV